MVGLLVWMFYKIFFWRFYETSENGFDFLASETELREEFFVVVDELPVWCRCYDCCGVCCKFFLSWFQRDLFDGGRNGWIIMMMLLWRKLIAFWICILFFLISQESGRSFVIDQLSSFISSLSPPLIIYFPHTCSQQFGRSSPYNEHAIILLTNVYSR